MRLIEADAYKEFHRRECLGCCATCAAYDDEDMTCKLIDEIPTAPDAVIVTRCKDCKYVNFTKHRDYLRCTKHCAFSFRPDDFCSYGEYRTNSGGNEHE